MTEFRRIREALGFEGTLRATRLELGNVRVTKPIVRKLRAAGADVTLLARQAGQLDSDRAWLAVFGDYVATPDARWVLAFIRRVVEGGKPQPELWSKLKAALLDHSEAP